MSVCDFYNKYSLGSQEIKVVVCVQLDLWIDKNLKKKLHELQKKH